MSKFNTKNRETRIISTVFSDNKDTNENRQEKNYNKIGKKPFNDFIQCVREKFIF